MSDVRARDRRMTRLTITGRLEVLDDARQHFDADRRVEGEALWEQARVHWGTSFAGCPGHAEAAQAREQARAREERRRRGEP